MSQSNRANEYADKLRSLVAPILQRSRELTTPDLPVAPREEQWSATAILAHIAEFLPYWAREARRVGRGPQGVAFGRTHEDPQRIAAVTDHAGDAVDRTVGRVADALTTAIRILGEIPDDGWVRLGRHMRRGEMTVTGILDAFLVEHLHEHARQFDDALAASRSAVSERQTL